jgi:hypothetical protein
MKTEDLQEARQIAADLAQAQTHSSTQLARLIAILSTSTSSVSEPSKPTSWNRYQHLPFSAVLSDSFLESVLWIQDQLKLSAHNLIVCMGFETGMTFSPSKKNPRSSATGLIQFMEFTAKRLGTTTAKLAAMTPEQQLGWVYKYFKAYGNDLSNWNLGDVYMSILWPAAIGKDDSYKMFVKGDKNFAVNSGLDVNKDGIVSRAECLVRIREVEQIGMRKTRA